MKKPLHIKKLALLNIPYVFIALFATKLGQAWRLAPGTDFSGKALHIMEGFAAAFQSALPSFHPIDLCVGVAAALLIRLIVYVKGKNAKKFRKNLEYGSARWGKPEDKLTLRLPICLAHGHQKTHSLSDLLKVRERESILMQMLQNTAVSVFQRRRYGRLKEIG